MDLKKILAVISTAILIGFSSNVSAATFKDVPTDHKFFNDLEQLAEVGVVKPDKNGNFNGDKVATRYNLALMLYQVVDQVYGFEEDPNEVNIADIPKNRNAYNVIAQMVSEGVMNTAANENFDGTRAVTRYEIAEAFYEILHMGNSIPNMDIEPYNDVSDGSRQYEFVRGVTAAGVMNGYNDKNFRGNDTVTRYELARLVYKLCLALTED